MQTQSSQSVETVTTLLIEALADVLRIGVAEVKHELPFDAMGLDSAGAFKLARNINDKLGTEFEPTILYEYPTVKALSAFLSARK